MLNVKPSLVLALSFCVWACGAPAPAGKLQGKAVLDFFVREIHSGTIVRPEDNKGKVQIIDFWATWCGPCREAKPKIEAVAEKYKSKGVVLLPISAESADEILKVDADPAKPSYYDPGGKANIAFGVEAIPRVIVTDREGKIVFDGNPLESDIDGIVASAAG